MIDGVPIPLNEPEQNAEQKETEKEIPDILAEISPDQFLKMYQIFCGIDQVKDDINILKYAALMNTFTSLKKDLMTEGFKEKEIEGCLYMHKIKGSTLADPVTRAISSKCLTSHPDLHQAIWNEMPNLPKRMQDEENRITQQEQEFAEEK